MTYTVRCADCQKALASYDSNDAESKRRADEASWRHSCREQKRRNREAQRRERRASR